MKRWRRRGRIWTIRWIFRPEWNAAKKFFLTRETEGEPNAHTTIELIENRGAFSLYRLTPHTGKKHQLRVHMMSLNMPLMNDALYPIPLAAGDEDYDKPLKTFGQKNRIYRSCQRRNPRI